MAEGFLNGFAERVMASVVCAFAFLSGGAQAAQLLAFPSVISFSDNSGGSNESVLTFTGPVWTGLDFFAASGNANVTQPPAGSGPTGSFSDSTGTATFNDTMFSTPGVLFSTSDSFVFTWSYISSNYLGNGVYNALFKGTIAKAGSFDPTPFELSFSAQIPASPDVAGPSWSAEGAVINPPNPITVPTTAALLGLGLAGVGAARRKRV